MASRPSIPPRKPTPADLRAAVGKSIPDLIGPGLGGPVLRDQPGPVFRCGGRHFGRPGNRFWPALAAGHTPAIAPGERPSFSGSDSASPTWSRARPLQPTSSPPRNSCAATRLARKVGRWQPRWVAILGVAAYRVAFDRPRAGLGRQADRLGEAVVGVLPNTSGLNANHRPADFAKGVSASCGWRRWGKTTSESF